MKKIDKWVRGILQKIKSADIYKILFCFLAFGFIGWVIESAVIYLGDGELAARGLLLVNFSLLNLPAIPVWGLPLIPIYGAGGLLIILFLNRFKKKWLKLFFYGMILMTIFELLGSYFCDFAYHQSYWEYTDFLNFQGRISVVSSIFWGVLSILVVDKIYPLITKWYDKLIKLKYTKLVLKIVSMYALVCLLARAVRDII